MRISFRNLKHRLIRSLIASSFLVLVCSVSSIAQEDWIRTGTGLGMERPRVAVPDFKAAAPISNQELLTIFNSTLFSDLENAGIFDVVSKSFYPLQQPGTPQEMRLDAWSNPPANAAMVAFGNMNVTGQDMNVYGWLFDVKNTTAPQVLGKQYREQPTTDNARLIAHKFADEIIFRLGGGIPGIAETKIYFVRNAGPGRKEIWQMDYDGAGQKPVVPSSSIDLSPRVAPDNSRLAFVQVGTGGTQILMYSFDLGRLVSFPRFGGTTISPAWSGDGTKLAFSSSRTGDPEIYVSDGNGTDPRRITEAKGPDVSPTWNPKTNAQIAFVSGRTGLPQIYTMESDGSNVQRMTDTGYAVSPSWSPNGQFLVFSWRRNYGPGAPGNQDIYIMDVATKRWVQLTHDGGSNDFPCWSPDGRHIIFQSSRTGTTQVWTMLADGTQQRQLTTSGKNEQPNWSFK
jgi:TolB protein